MTSPVEDRPPVWRDRRVVILVAAAVLALAGALMSYLAQDRGDRIRIGVGGWDGFVPLVAAEEWGFFAARGLPVALEPLGSPERERGLAEGRLDCAVTTLNAWLQWADRGLDVAVLFTTDLSTGGDAVVALREAGAPRTMRELAGRRVGLWRAGAPLLLFARALAAAGVAPSAVTIVDLGPNETADALAAGRIDAAVLYGDPLTRLSGRITVLASSADFPVVEGAFGCRRAALDARPEAARGLAAAVHAAAACLAGPRETPPSATCPTRTGQTRLFGHDLARLAGGVPEVRWATAPIGREALAARLARARDDLAPYGVFANAARIDIERLTRDAVPAP